MGCDGFADWGRARHRDGCPRIELDEVMMQGEVKDVNELRLLSEFWASIRRGSMYRALTPIRGFAWLPPAGVGGVGISKRTKWRFENSGSRGVWADGFSGIRAGGACCGDSKRWCAK